LPRRTNEEVAAARAKVIAERETVVTRYRDGESMKMLAEAYEVDSTWLAGQFSEWNEPVRGRSEAAVTRGPGAVPPVVYKRC
jgi:hypothetical protein